MKCHNIFYLTCHPLDSTSRFLSAYHTSWVVKISLAVNLTRQTWRFLLAFFTDLWWIDDKDFSWPIRFAGKTLYFHEAVSAIVGLSPLLLVCRTSALKNLAGNRLGRSVGKQKNLWSYCTPAVTALFQADYGEGVGTQSARVQTIPPRVKSL